MKQTNKLKEKALKQHIPIITDEALNFIIQVIKEQNFKTMLEIGTAVGYSSIMLAPYLINITTIEREESLIDEARKNIKAFDLENKVSLIYGDALNIELKETYDLIFIDGAKAQYINFFAKYQKHLNKNGMIICDNLHFHHLDLNKVNKNTKRLILKLQAFKEYLKNETSFETTFYDIGDGLSISRRK